MVNEKKLQATIAYLAEQTQPGKVKLFKLLYFADFAAYAKRGQSITSETYEHFPMGPVPIALYRDLRDGLNTYAELGVVTSGMPIPTQLMLPKPDADLSVLSAEERGILDQVVKEYGQMTGTRLREITHQEIPYLATAPGKEIPYYLAVYRTARRPTADELRRITSNSELLNELRESLRELRQSDETSSRADNSME